MQTETYSISVEGFEIVNHILTLGCIVVQARRRLGVNIAANAQRRLTPRALSDTGWRSWMLSGYEIAVL